MDAARAEVDRLEQRVRDPRGRGRSGRTGAGPRAAWTGCRCRPPGASAPAAAAAPARPAPGRGPAPARSRRRPAGSPRGSRPSWSCRRRWARGARTARRGGPRARRRRAPGGRRRPCGGPRPGRQRPCRRHGLILAYWVSKSSLADLADLDAAEDAVLVDEVGLRRGHGAPGLGQRPVGVVHGGPRGTEIVEERLGQLRLVLVQDADHLEAVGGTQLGELLLEQRELLAAGRAPRRPEVDDDRLALQGREVHGVPSSAVPASGGAGRPVRASGVPPSPQAAVMSTTAARRAGSARARKRSTGRMDGPRGPSRLWRRDGPRHVGMHRADEAVLPGGKGRHIVDHNRRPRDQLAS